MDPPETENGRWGQIEARQLAIQMDGTDIRLLVSSDSGAPACAVICIDQKPSVDAGL